MDGRFLLLGVSSSTGSAAFSMAGLLIGAHAEWRVGIDVVAARSFLGQEVSVPKYQGGHDQAVPDMEESLESWIGSAPKLVSDWPELETIYQRSLTDLAALRFYTAVVCQGGALRAAGLPWFISIVGRDTIITSFQALPFTPQLARVVPYLDVLLA